MSDAPGADPRAELVQQLLAYKRFRDAASELETRKLDWDRRFPAGGAGVDDEELKARSLRSERISISRI
jgi:chromatin segregation and condensation protein Rec8/ScpA/Scc1 (kleisin family)